MPDVRYVCFSDMHLGAENSILTELKNDGVQTDTLHASPVMIKMVECLKEIINRNTGPQKPKLVLNGDLVELALTTANSAAMAFQRFIELVMPENGERLFDDEIIFLAGNHDHNLWETARNMYYVSELKKIKPGEYIFPEIHSTKMFRPEDIKSYFLTGLIHCYPHLQDVEVKVSYPAFAESHPVTNKCVVFCHGHYIESMYSLMTNFSAAIFPEQKRPKTMETLEIENYAWVDFFWSTLGRSGIVGKDINLIYDKLQDAGAVDRMLENIAGHEVQNQKSALRKWIERKAMLFILKMTLGHMAANERNEPDVELTPDALGGLKRFIEVQLYNQLHHELHGKLPENISFIFGHTHKPCVRKMPFEKYAQPIKLYNSGGWVVDTLKQQALHGGSIVLADENFDVVSLHMYKEGNYKIGVEEIRNKDEAPSAFFIQLQQTVQQDADPWKSFSCVAEKEVNLRYKNLATLIKEN